MQTSLNRPFSAKRYKPCFWDVRPAVTDKATDCTCRIVHQLPWKRAFNDMIYEVKCDDLTIKEHGWPNLIPGDTVIIRRSAEVPLEYHALECKLKNLTKADESGAVGGCGRYNSSIKAHRVTLSYIPRTSSRSMYPLTISSVCKTTRGSDPVSLM